MRRATYSPSPFPLFSPAPFLLFTFSLLLLLVACTAPDPQLPPTSTLAPTLTQTPTPTVSPTLAPSVTATRPTRRPTSPIAPTQTPVPTLIPSATPTVEIPFSFAGTTFPQPNEIISPENASRLVKLAQWGYGRITDIAYSLNGALLFVETSIGGAVFEVTNLEEPLEVFYQPLEEEIDFFEVFENDVVNLNEIQARYDLDIPKRIFPFQEYGFQELGCDERFPFTPHLRDAEAIQAQYSPLENNFFVTYRYADDWMPTLLNLYQGKDGGFLYSIEEDTGILKATYSPDGAFLAIATSDGAIKILDVESGQEVRNSHKFQERFYSVTFNIKGEQLLADTGGQLDFYHLQNGVWDGTVDIVRADVYSLFLDTGILAVGDEHGQILYLNVNTRDHVRITQAHNEYVTGVAYSSNGEILASSGADCSIKLWDANGKLLNELENLVSPGQDGENTRQKVYNLVFAPNGNYLLGETFTSLLAIWDIDSGKIIRQLRLDIPYFGPQRFYTFAPNQDILAIATFDPEIKFVDLQTFETIQIFTVPVTDGFISQIAFSPDGRLIVATTTNGWMYLWNVSDQSLLLAKRAHVEGIYGITFSQDGRLIAAGSLDGTISVWGIAP